MKSFAATLGLATTFASVINAHSVFTTLLIDNVDQGDGTCVRMPNDPSTATDPIASITSTDMACGRDGENAVAFTCPASAGSKMTFEWRLIPDYSSPGSIDKSHKGPCAVYLKQVADIKSTPAAGPGWFKIWDDGYDEKAGQWCTEKLIANNGLMSVQLPTGLPGGYYLVRPELLALHEADKGDPQFYTGCAQIFIDGPSGTLEVPAEDSVSIPGYVQMGQKSVSFNVWQNPLDLPYPIPGPKVFNPMSSNGAAPKAVSSQTYDKAAVGVVPDNCLLKVDNWCGTEVPSYSNANDCYASADACDKQLKACYAGAGPTGSAGCKLWEAKCQGIQGTCASGSPSGPPNAGAKLQSPDRQLPGPIPNAEDVVNTVVASVLPAASAAPPAATLAPSPAPVAAAPVVKAAPASSPAPVAAAPVVKAAPASSPAPVAAAPVVKAAPAPSASAAPVQPAKVAQPVQQAVKPVAAAAPAPVVTTMVTVYTTVFEGAPGPAATNSPQKTTEHVKSTKPEGGAKPQNNNTKPSGKSKSVHPMKSEAQGTPQGDLKVSLTGQCGAASGLTCKGSAFGECCSKSGRCGSSRFHCGAGSSSTRGCQENYGVCKGNDGGAVAPAQNGVSAATTQASDNQGTGSQFQQTAVRKMLDQLTSGLHFF
ncbi:hypothetical protein PpBr36_02891 [Pyricularia pennisetigena]|uniref:hypothetical protein n=1 Tax=Pyricularia pennisetigena TaxID=1578925 RepID=UPI00114EC1F4|nr:hypothetical protein PpBr36_02891 [Pyricularia pennisetigena]TLS31259.1 hypothetical protein PpBr36_02891 [Pyricularia pennisetigena]